MSVILKALKSARQEAEANVSSAQQADPALHVPEKNISQIMFIKKDSGQGSWQELSPYILGGVFVVLLAFAATYYFLTREKEFTLLTQNPVIQKTNTASTEPASPVSAQTVADNTPANTAIPVSTDLILQQAQTAFQENKLDESLTLFKQAIVQDPENAVLHNGLGLVFLKKELFSNAQSEFEKALEIDDTCAECFNNLGYLKTRLGAVVEAKNYFEKALVLQSEYPDPHFNLAVLYEKQGDISNAVIHYKQFVELSPVADSDVVTKVKARIKMLSGQ